MGRRPKGPRTFYRGNLCYVEWADGSGGKIRHRLRTVDGVALCKGDPEEEITLAAAADYYQWVRLPATTSGTTRPKQAAVTIGDLTTRYAMVYAADWSRRTRYAYGRCMHIIESYFGADTPMDSISIEAAEDLKLWLSAYGKKDGTELAARSVNNVLDFARSIFRYAQRMGWTAQNVFEFVKPRRAVPVYASDPFSPDEVESLLDTARNCDDLVWFYPVVLCVALTGCRRGPLPQMLVSDYDADRKLLSLRSEIAKQGRPFCYAVPEVLAIELTRITTGRNLNEPLFVDNSGKPLNEKAFDPSELGTRLPPSCRAWHRLLRRANVRPRGIHNLRRAAVTNLAEADVTMDKIVAVTGHTVEVARNLYLRLNRESQRATMEKLAKIYGQNSTDPDDLSIRSTADAADSPCTFHLQITKDELSILRSLLHQQTE